MRQLRLVGLAEDGDSLVLESPTGESYRLPIDERVRAATRGDLTRLGQIEIEMDNPLRPREIQMRVRAGESAEQVAASSGMPLDRVLRFASAVLQERSRVVAQARMTAIRPASADTLAPLVEERLVSRGTDAGTLRWDAWRGEDGGWLVRLAWRHAGDREHTATWSFDLARRALQPADPAAEQLSAEEYHARTITAVTPLAVAARAADEAGRPAHRPADDRLLPPVPDASARAVPDASARPRLEEIRAGRPRPEATGPAEHPRTAPATADLDRSPTTDLDRSPTTARPSPAAPGPSPAAPGPSPAAAGPSPATPGPSPATPGASPATPGASPATPGASPATPGRPSPAAAGPSPDVADRGDRPAPDLRQPSRRDRRAHSATPVDSAGRPGAEEVRAGGATRAPTPEAETRARPTPNDIRAGRRRSEEHRFTARTGEDAQAPDRSTESARPSGDDIRAGGRRSDEHRFSRADGEPGGRSTEEIRAGARRLGEPRSNVRRVDARSAEDDAEAGDPVEEPRRLAAGGGSTIPGLVVDSAESEEDRARRATVPSWDDILLGVRRRH